MNFVKFTITVISTSTSTSEGQAVRVIVKIKDVKIDHFSDDNNNNGSYAGNDTAQFSSAIKLSITLRYLITNLDVDVMCQYKCKHK